ncbi:SpoVR family protein [Pseudomonas fluvialis]|uniref:SpoVR family protein n=1 Tax=Pseudomonas fluvialis TaxID=1793966 RepID=A0A2I0CLF3_9PSED|nr:SpoVR family protein [Pseudomonas pharmacofabricae]PKF69996.1 SpoVR family protein [Pseudomonas pharmacofabricae]
MNPRSRQPISTDSEWSFELIRRYDQEIARLAERYALDIYPNQIEIISAEQMMDAYASVGMPIGYHHWSYGKQFLATEKGYKRGQMGLAYEIVINSDPCIAYLMEENTLCMQALVIAHACYGHNSFFKGNYLFRSWTDASSIIDYLVFAKQYISQCEERHGIDAVEELLDSCHALMNYGVDRYKRPYPISAEEERRRQSEREEHLQRQINDLWRTIPKASGRHNEEQAQRWPAEPQENILYFLEKHAPLLEPWQREVIRIVRKLAQYFYPQRQTQVMNEGWATFWHYTLINDLYDEGLVSDGFMLEFLQYHSGVVLQPAFDSPWYSGINPYALGFAMYRDIRRICEQPNEEDRRWFPEIAGSDWLSTLKFAMQNFKDESFILQYLSPKVMRDLRLFSVLDDDQQDSLQVSAIHDDSGYRHLRETLAAQYNLGNREPNVQIWSVDRRGDRSLTLRHSRHDRRPLGESSQAVLKHLHRLWGFDIHLESHQGEQLIETLHMPPRAEPQESQSSMAL